MISFIFEVKGPLYDKSVEENEISF